VCMYVQCLPIPPRVRASDADWRAKQLPLHSRLEECYGDDTCLDCSNKCY
jgi:hypothetical protein